MARHGNHPMVQWASDRPGWLGVRLGDREPLCQQEPKSAPSSGIEKCSTWTSPAYVDIAALGESVIKIIISIVNVKFVSSVG
jgi:hypothetical protein